MNGKRIMQVVKLNQIIQLSILKYIVPLLSLWLFKKKTLEIYFHNLDTFKYSMFALFFNTAFKYH